VYYDLGHLLLNRLLLNRLKLNIFNQGYAILLYKVHYTDVCVYSVQVNVVAEMKMLLTKIKILKNQLMKDVPTKIFL